MRHHGIPGIRVKTQETVKSLDIGIPTPDKDIN